MNAAQVYIVVALVVMVVIAVLLYAFTKDKRAHKVHPLTGLAFALILAGMLFRENQIFSYGLMGAGIIAAVIDMVKRSRPKA